VVQLERLLAFFIETRHAYGRTALCLSGGAVMGMHHAGVVKALLENGLLPAVISGASAGSIVCGVVGCSTDEELLKKLVMPQSWNFNFFALKGFKQAEDILKQAEAIHAERRNEKKRQREFKRQSSSSSSRGSTGSSSNSGGGGGSGGRRRSPTRRRAKSWANLEQKDAELLDSKVCGVSYSL
jgi:uncharacterized membrane protein YgcG